MLLFIAPPPSPLFSPSCPSSFSSSVINPRKKGRRGDLPSLSKELLLWISPPPGLPLEDLLYFFLLVFLPSANIPINLWGIIRCTQSKQSAAAAYLTSRKSSKLESRMETITNSRHQIKDKKCAFKQSFFMIFFCL